MIAPDEIDLAARARAGDRAAAETLLRRHAREIRSIAWSLTVRHRISFEVFDDALAEATIATWKTIATWDPKRSPLVAYARLNIERAVRRTVARLGHAVAIPVARAKKRQRAIDARERARGTCASMEAPGPDEAAPLRDLLPGASVSPEMLLDLRLALSRVAPRAAGILLDVAMGSQFADVGRDLGMTREGVRTAHQRALAKAAGPFRRRAA